MSMRKLTAAVLLTASFAVGGLASQAYAAPRWIVLGKFLEAGEKLNKVLSHFGVLTAKWVTGGEMSK